MFKRVCQAAGAGDGCTPRELRTSFVSLLSHRGVAIEEIARLAGHASTRTTEVVYRRELRPVITTGAEIMDQLFGASQTAAPAKRAFSGTPETHAPLAHASHAGPGGTGPPGLTGDSHQGDPIGHYAM
jgi:hypothetical protein